jgi:hypothetical protein
MSARVLWFVFGMLLAALPARAATTPVASVADGWRAVLVAADDGWWVVAAVQEQTASAVAPRLPDGWEEDHVRLADAGLALPLEVLARLDEAGLAGVILPTPRRIAADDVPAADEDGGPAAAGGVTTGGSSGPSAPADGSGPSAPAGATGGGDEPGSSGGGVFEGDLTLEGTAACERETTSQGAPRPGTGGGNLPRPLPPPIDPDLGSGTTTPDEEDRLHTDC